MIALVALGALAGAIGAGSVPVEAGAHRGHFRRGGRVSGSLRVRGTIGTGDRCASHTLRFTARHAPRSRTVVDFLR